MSRPLLLDLFCGAGGCAVGYNRAGFDVLGVDHHAQPHYPYSSVQDDAIAVLERLAAGHTWRGYRRTDLAAIHASPPCQAYSVARNCHPFIQGHPKLDSIVRDLLLRIGQPYVLEGVPGTPLRQPALVCGRALGLAVRRHRLFESSAFLWSTTCPRGHPGRWATVYGGGAPRGGDRGRRVRAEESRAAMGIDWMSRAELSQAIPPAYTEWIGRQLLAAVTAD